MGLTRGSKWGVQHGKSVPSCIDLYWNIIALNFPGLGFINCDDEEDCIQGSGSGDGINNRPIDFIPREGGNGAYNGGPNGGSNNEEVFQVGGTDSEFFLI